MRAITEPYRYTWRFIRLAPGFVLGMALFLLGISIFAEYFDKGLSITFVPYVFVLFLMLRAMMFGETRMQHCGISLARPQRLGRFYLTGFILFAILLALTLALFLALEIATGFLSTSETRTGPLLLTLLVGSCLVAALFGTMLPAAAAADDTELAQRVVNAIKSGPRVFAGMLFGPCLCLLALFVLLGLAGAVDGASIYLDAGGVIDPVKILFAVPLALLRISIGFLGCAVLIVAYRSRAPEEITEVMV